MRNERRKNLYNNKYPYRSGVYHTVYIRKQILTMNISN